MKVNYANNPLLGPGKWDPLLSLLTPSGDAIVIPTNLIEAIKSRARVLKSRGIAVFRTVKLQDGSFSLRRLSGNQRRGNFELYEKIKSMQVGDEPLVVSEKDFEAGKSCALKLGKSSDVKYKTSGCGLEFGKIWRIK